MNVIQRIKQNLTPRFNPPQPQLQRLTPYEIDQIKLQQMKQQEQMRQQQQQPVGRFSVPREKQILSAYRTNNVLSSTQPQPQNYPQQRQTLTLCNIPPPAPRLSIWR